MIEEKIVRPEYEHVDQSNGAHLAQQPPQSTDLELKNSKSAKNWAKIFPVIEGIPSKKTQISYQRCFNHFLDHIKIHDLQVLLDFSQKVIKQMVVDYILYLRDERKLSRATINTTPFSNSSLL